MNTQLENNIKEQIRFHAYMLRRARTEMLSANLFIHKQETAKDIADHTYWRNLFIQSLISFKNK